MILHDLKLALKTGIAQYKRLILNFVDLEWH